MSVTGYSHSDRPCYRRSLHRRDDSGELDVFEAARYFSGYTDVISNDYNNPTNYISHKFAHDRDDAVKHNSDAGKPLRSSNGREQPIKEKIGKHGHGHGRQQPSSPGGRLASFLNSLFSQSSSKKKKKSTTKSLTSLKDNGGGGYDVHDDSGGGWRRRRRSSISHFWSSSNTTTSTTVTSSNTAITDSSKTLFLYSSSSSGFRTPPPPGKLTRDLRSLSDRREEVVNLRPTPFVQSDRHRGGGLWKKKYGETGENRGFSFRVRKKKFGENDDVESNSSDSRSDLFELQNYDLGGYCSSGLPVYETTRPDSIRRGASVSNVAA